MVGAAFAFGNDVVYVVETDREVATAPSAVPGLLPIQVVFVRLVGCQFPLVCPPWETTLGDIPAVSERRGKPQLGVETHLHQLRRLRRQVYAYPLPFQPLRRYRSGSAPAEGVKHNITLVAGRFDYAFQETHRFLGGIAGAFFSVAGDVRYVNPKVTGWFPQVTLSVDFTQRTLSFRQIISLFSSNSISRSLDTLHPDG